MADSDGPILLVDDFSTDDTATIARNTAGDRISVITPDTHVGVGHARQTAVEHITTPYGIWLDADDAFMPGRTARHLDMISRAEHDLVFDEGLLVNGKDESFMHDLPIPDFLLKKDGIVRQFERNWLPLTHCSFVTNFAQSVGYDREFMASEDYDFMLRALMAGGRYGYIREAGYQYYHYPTSLSRALKTATVFSNRATAKHSDDNLIKFMDSRHTLPEVDGIYVRATAAKSRGDNVLASELFRLLLKDDTSIAPYGASASALGHFGLGVMCLERGNDKDAAQEAEAHFIAAQQTWPAPEVCNNLAVAMAMNGKLAEARKMWNRLNENYKDYFDPFVNLGTILTSRKFTYTRTPLRSVASRSLYLNNQIQKLNNNE